MAKTFWNGKKVFLTGHTGFKGSWLSIWLNSLGADLMGFALEPNTNPSLYKLANLESKMKSVIGDIRDLEKLKQTMKAFNPDIVIHLAAQPLVRSSYENPVETYEINVMGTVNVLESVRYCENVKAVLNVTTDKVYENKEWEWPYRETDILGGFDPYSNSKACSELVTNSFIQSFFNVHNYEKHKVAIATARAGNVIGGGDWAKNRLIPDILKAIEEEQDIYIRNPHAIRPWQHVLEPLMGYLLLAEKLYVEGPIYNGSWNFGPELSSCQSVSWIANRFIDELSNKVKLVTSESEYHEAQTLKLDISKVKHQLGWSPQLTIEQTIQLIIEWQQAFNSKQNIYEICIKQIKGMNMEC